VRQPIMLPAANGLPRTDVVASRTDQPAPPLEPLLLTVEQAATLLGISRTRTYALTSRGELESLAISPGCRRVPRAAVLDWIERQRAAARGTSHGDG
jgi:excisionase family DNA binding protein